MRRNVLRVLGATAVAGLLAMGPTTAAIAADAGLSGTITNQLTGAPAAAGIIIQHRDGSGWNFTNSDAEGKFSFPDAEPGEYIVHVAADGYVEQWLYGHQDESEAD